MDINGMYEWDQWDEWWINEIINCLVRKLLEYTIHGIGSRENVQDPP